MTSNQARAVAVTVTLLRVVFGALFLFHGLQKLVGIYFPPDHMPPVGSQLWIGAVIEVVGGALIAVGLFTRVAAFLCAGQMAVAYFQFHWKLQMGDGMIFPAVNQGEASVLYCFAFLFLAAYGGGPASLDALVFKKR